MLFKFTLASWMLFSSAFTAASQVNSDPTFNGTVAQATCYLRGLTACRYAACEQMIRGCQGDLCGTLSLSLKARRYTFGQEKEPLQITEISPAEVGKPLWVKFQIQMKSGLGVGKLTLRPERLGEYATTAVVFLGSDDDPSGHSFSLINFDCERIPEEP